MTEPAEALGGAAVGMVAVVAAQLGAPPAVGTIDANAKPVATAARHR